MATPTGENHAAGLPKQAMDTSYGQDSKLYRKVLNIHQALSVSLIHSNDTKMKFWLILKTIIDKKQVKPCEPAKKFPAPAGYTIEDTSFGKFLNELFLFEIDNIAETRSNFRLKDFLDSRILILD